MKMLVSHIRANHSAIMWTTEKDLEQMYIFGGVTQDTTRIDDFWIYTPSINSWSQVDDGRSGEDTIKLSPIARSEHTNCLYKDQIIICGGRNDRFKEMNDVMMFDLYSKKWHTSSHICNIPSPDKTFVVSAKKAESPALPKSPASSTKQGGNNNQQEMNSFSLFSMQNSGARKTPSPTHTNAGASSKRTPSSMKKVSEEKKGPVKGRDKTPVKTKKGLAAAPPPALNLTEIESDLMEKKLMTPTTSTMLNSSVMYAGEKGLESYFQFMKRRKRTSNAGEGESEIVAKGRIPCGRSGHTVITYDGFMIIFGGDRAQLALNDVYIYKLH